MHRDSFDYLRAELGAFSPIMENAGGGEHRPWTFEDGRSLTTYIAKDDYSHLLGLDILIAPMLEAGTSRTLTLPEGRWVYSFDSSHVFDGGTRVTLDIPMAEFPAFVREGSQVAETLLVAGADAPL
jgi:alpha-glucosidase (family GH31 glycosyl hydrolase)